MSRTIFRVYNLFVKNTFNTNLTLFRKRKGLSQRELARLLDVSHRTIAYYETETTSIPLDKLELIAKILHVTPGDLVNPIDESFNTFLDIDVRLLKKLRSMKKLPDRDQRAISNHINALLSKVAE